MNFRPSECMYVRPVPSFACSVLKTIPSSFSLLRRSIAVPTGAPDLLPVRRIFTPGVVPLHAVV